MEKEFDVDVSIKAYMGACITVQVDTEGKTEEEVLDEAERLAKEKVNSGDISWEYQGVTDDPDFRIEGIS